MSTPRTRPADTDPETTGRRSARRPAAVRLGVATAAAVVGALLIPAAPAQASLSLVGPVAGNGYPAFMEDSTGLRLRLCDDPANGCAMPAVPNPGAPVSFPGNYAGENFYFAAATADASYEAALEAAFTGAGAEAGEQIMFSRIRIRMDNLVAGATYGIAHPYGTLSLVATAVRGGGGEINYTDDQGCMAPPCGDFSNVLTGFVGDQSPSTSMNFLTRVGFNPATASQGAEIGNPLTPTAVTGSVFDTNYFEVVGPNAGGPGVDRLYQDTFTIEGQLAAPADPNLPSTPDLSAASDSGRADTDNITNVARPTLLGTAPAGSPVDLLVDGAVVDTTNAGAGGTYSLVPGNPLSSANHRAQVRVPNPAYLPTRDPQNPAYVPESDPANPAYDVVAYPDPPVYDVGTPAELTSGTLNFKVDTVAPPVVIGTPKPTDGTIDPTPTFTFSSAEADTTLECSLARAPQTAGLYESCVSPLTYDDQPNASYTFATRATDAAGNVGNPATHTWTIGSTLRAPAAPAGVSATAGNAAAVVSWSVPDNGGSAITGYQVQPFNASTGAAVGAPRPAGAAATSLSVPSLTNGVAYDFAVRAINAQGTGAYSARSNPVTPTAPVTTAPTAPTGVTATAGNASATVAWTAPSNAATSNITGYRIRRYAGTTATVQSTVTVAATASSWVISGLTNGQSYSFDVTAVSGTRIGAVSARTAVVRPTAPVTDPAPTVTTRTPAANAIAVARFANATAKLSEPVTGVSGTTVTLRRASTGALVTAAVSYNATTRVATLNPNANLAANVRYTVTLTAGITDATGQALAPTTWSFTTGA